MTIPQSVRGPLGRARRSVNRHRNALGRAVHVESAGLHLVRSPVFVLSSVRSGSTLLRSILNTHPAICAPHELHLARLRVTADRPYVEEAWEHQGVGMAGLENVLWDRALHLVLVRSGKRIIVDKTPQNAYEWQRIREFWPDARYIHLRRHPVATVRSMSKAQEHRSEASHVRTMVRYGEALDAARAALPGPTVRYEELTTDPERVVRELCHYLGVRFHTSMLNYRGGGGNRAGLGDWSEKIRSGRILPPEPLPSGAVVPDELQDLVTRWGY